MHTIFQGYTMVHNDIPTFFAGANTGHGFVGAYGDFAKEEKLRQLWILKGGSGTGKSTLMRKIAADAVGHSRVQYLCSSDPTSLDAVVVDEAYVVLDGTAPHVWEMAYPGAVSEIVYLGKYWDAAVLRERREEIVRISREKKAAYEKGYRVLAALSVLEMETYEAAMAVLDREKIQKWGQRLLRAFPKAERSGGVWDYRTWSIGMRGLWRTDGLWHGCDRHWVIEDAYETAPCLLTILTELCQAAQVPVLLSRHPINDRIVEMAIPALSLHLSIGDAGEGADKTICMQRFLQKDLLQSQKGAIRLTCRCMVEMLSLAVEHFAVAGERHMALEEIYKSAMDFVRLRRDTALLRKQIIAELS